MPIKRAQYGTKCYCNSVAATCCSNSHVACSAGSGSIFSVASKHDKQSSNARMAAKHKQNTDFVKTKPKTTRRIDDNKNRRGLGHSNLHCATNYSRRNSAATTVTFSTPCATPASARSSYAITPILKTPTPSPSPSLSSTTYNAIRKNLPVAMSTLGDNFRALSVASKSERDSECGDAPPQAYTEQRRYYESAQQLMQLIAAQGDKHTALNLIGGDGGAVAAAACVGDAAMDAERLRRLQEFRLQNAEECFTVHRQLDLHLPLREITSTHRVVEQLMSKQPGNTFSAQQRKAEVFPANVAVVKQRAQQPQHTPVTPYAVRQRLLELRLEAEELKRAKPEHKLYAPLGKSCALRYQKTY